MSSELKLPKLPDAACTGCGGCRNICPKDAIVLQPDHEGFLMPSVDVEKCIGCGACEKKCPALHWQNENCEEHPDCYALRASDEIRQTSSSGGLFTLAAQEIFRMRGVVVGAVFDKNMNLSLSIAKNMKELEPMRGSKYVQSDTGMIYNEVLRYLKKKVPVLFTGCPCQIAAMKNLAGDADDLYTIDLVCHGVPSQAVLQRYLREKFPDKHVIDVRFRDKKHGWSATSIDVDFSDGSSYHGTNRGGDLYEVIFQQNVALRSCCHDCKFASFPRVGDLSMGDFWGIQNVDASQTDGKGTSMVFVNSQKGRMLLEKIAPNAQIKQIVSKDYLQFPNRLKPIYPAHRGRDYFLHLLQTNSMEDSLKMTMDNRHDIGLVGIHTVGNFGGALTYFALYKVLCDMGYSVLMIERPGNSSHKPAISKIYHQSPFPAYDVAKIYPTKQAMKELNQFCDTFVVGSDQLFNDALYNNFGRWCTLDWVQDNKKKIAYAASFGHDYIWSPEETRAEMAHFMQNFDAFSVREESGVKVCREEFDVDATWVLDPVFLCDPEYYRELAKHSDMPVQNGYVGAYILDPSKEKSDILKYIANKKKLSTDIYTEMFYQQKDMQDFELPVHFGGLIEDRLSSIVHSDFFVADSFHGICFAILMKKDFVAIVNEKRGRSRFDSILGLLGLKDRLVENLHQLKANEKQLLQPIDYDAVYARLDRERDRCLGWLREALENPVKKPVSTYDLLVKQLDALTVRVNQLSASNAALKRKVQHLSQYAGFTLAGIRDLKPYLKALQANIDHYVVAIAVKDTPGHFFNEELFKELQKIGVTVNLTQKHWYGYAAIIDGGKLLAEKAEYQKAVTVKADASGVPVVATSKPLRAGNATAISFNGVGSSVCRRGLNVVVYDKTKHCICDSVCFDTHTKTFECSR